MAAASSLALFASVRGKNRSRLRLASCQGGGRQDSEPEDVPAGLEGGAGVEPQRSCAAYQLEVERGVRRQDDDGIDASQRRRGELRGGQLLDAQNEVRHLAPRTRT